MKSRGAPEVTLDPHIDSCTRVGRIRDVGWFKLGKHYVHVGATFLVPNSIKFNPQHKKFGTTGPQR